VHKMMDSRHHPHTWINTSRLFYTAPYQLCSNQVDYLRGRLLSAEYLIIIDANRAAQFRAVPNLFPVVAGFYARLIDGQLGFDLMRRYKVYPELAGVKIIDDTAVPDFLGYDHPAVMIFRRSDITDVEKAFADWHRDIRLNTYYPDRDLQAITAMLLDGRLREAQALLKNSAHRHSNTQITQLIEAKVFRMLGRESEARTAKEHVWPENVTGLMSHINHDDTIYLVPALLSLSVAELGLPNLAIEVLTDGIARTKSLSLDHSKRMAESYRTVAHYMLQNGHTEAFEHSLSLSMRIHPDRMGLNLLAARALERGDGQKAAYLWRQSLEIDPHQAKVHASLGTTILQNDTLSAMKAFTHLQTAIELDPELGDHLQSLLTKALRITTQQTY